MKRVAILAAWCLTSVTALAAAPANCGCECCKGKETCCCAAAEEPAAPASPRYPLKGVVVGLLPERHALLVKHEEIPGVMRAMTMVLKVGPAPLKAAREGQALTGQLTRRDDGWWLEDVVLAAPPAP
jgi:Cu/Ag efflux protein CusF